VRVLTLRTLVFDDVEALESVGVDAAAFHKGDYARTREVGAAARFLDMDGLIVPSARWPCANLVLFLDRLADLETLTVVEQRDVNWPAWRESQVPKI
jgi:RES domain-containing protein